MKSCLSSELNIQMANLDCIPENKSRNIVEMSQVIVVVVPFPAQGHLNQLLHLSSIISSYNIPVHYVGTAAHNRQAKLRVHGLSPISISNISFHDLSTPPYISPPPNPNATIKFPSHLQPLFNASSHLRAPVAELLSNLSPTANRIVVIHDSMMASIVQDIGSIPNGESYVFHSISTFSIFWFFWEVKGKPFTFETKVFEALPTLEDCFTPEFLQFIHAQHDFGNLNSGKLYNTCRAIEATYIDLLKDDRILGYTKQWAIGPFNPMPVKSDIKNHTQRDESLQWLDKQTQNSVMFISFGTTTSLTNEQIHELAIGLENSEQKFIWVLRDADKGDIFAEDDHFIRSIQLPEGYEQRIKNKGLILRTWVPQLEILAHSSTGGFMSHCGWNSCMESMSMGVPIAAWPMHSDQPRNTALITNVLKIGTLVKDWERRNELVTSLMVEESVRILMASQEGDEMRKNARLLGDAVRKSVEEGGSTRAEMESFLAHISRGEIDTC